MTNDSLINLINEQSPQIIQQYVNVCILENYFFISFSITVSAIVGVFIYIYRKYDDDLAPIFMASIVIALMTLLALCGVMDNHMVNENPKGYILKKIISN